GFPARAAMVCVLEPSADRSGAGSPAQPVLRSDGALCRTGPCRGADHRLHAGAQDHRAHLSLCADGAGGAYPRAGRPYQRLPRRVLAGGAPRHRTAALQWRVARRRLDECPGAGHRCGIPGCRAVGGLPGHDRQHLAAGRPRDRGYWTKPGYPAQDVEVRAASGDLFRIVDESRRRLVGTVDAVRAFEQVHPGAVYLHQGETYVVQQLDLTRRIAAVTPGDADYYTQHRSTTDLDILESLKQRSWGSTTASFGDVEVTTQVIAFARKRLFSEEVLDEEPLDLPEQRLQTAALWFVIPEDLEAEVRRQRLDLAGGIHAVEHAAIGVLPLFAMCDRWDLGGVSYPVYPELGAPAIFIYEGHPGGVGIAEKGYELLDDLMAATLHTLEACPCEAGCPSCIQSPKCGNMNEPLDKAAAILLLQGLLGRRTSQQPAVGSRQSKRRLQRHMPRGQDL